MKRQQNHGFTSFDILTLVFSLVVIAAISSPILSRNMESDKIALTQKELENVAQSLIQNNEPIKNPASPNRGIASVRAVADIIDPWGMPYRHAFLRDGKNSPKKLIVWSLGPDKRNDSYREVTQGAIIEGPSVFEGDDLGSVFSAD
ncbi:MAG: hypothetical protein SGI74_14295 [Oligoflexia bacterium]|nr:hypothetical protein [Oligoflexia bacterium]